MISSEHLFEFDKSFNKNIIGTDEAGRGPGAGGVFAAAVHFEKVTNGLIKDLEILNDSKKLTPKKRDSIYDIIKNNTNNRIVCIEVGEIEEINILNSSLKAMNIACMAVAENIGYNSNILTLVDGNKLIKEYPMYNWKKNAGYLTAEHLKAIEKYGLSPYHRPSFLRKFYEKKSKTEV